MQSEMRLVSRENPFHANEWSIHIYTRKKEADTHFSHSNLFSFERCSEIFVWASREICISERMQVSERWCWMLEWRISSRLMTARGKSRLLSASTLGQAAFVLFAPFCSPATFTSHPMMVKNLLAAAHSNELQSRPRSNTQCALRFICAKWGRITFFWADDARLRCTPEHLHAARPPCRRIHFLNSHHAAIIFLVSCRERTRCPLRQSGGWPWIWGQLAKSSRCAVRV